jgi:hypothetical protein
MSGLRNHRWRQWFWVAALTAAMIVPALAPAARAQSSGQKVLHIQQSL